MRIQHRLFEHPFNDDCNALVFRRDRRHQHVVTDVAPCPLFFCALIVGLVDRRAAEPVVVLLN